MFTPANFRGTRRPLHQSLLADYIEAAQTADGVPKLTGAQKEGLDCSSNWPENSPSR